MRKILPSLLTALGLAITGLAPGQSRAADLTTLVGFNLTDGAAAGQSADADGNLFVTTYGGGASGHTPTISSTYQHFTQQTVETCRRGCAGEFADCNAGSCKPQGGSTCKSNYQSCIVGCNESNGGRPSPRNCQ
jgi:hypothetical protein